MNEDQLSRSLEDLFSDVPSPDPQASGDADVTRERIGQPRPGERGSALEEAGVPWSLEETPPAAADVSPPPAKEAPAEVQGEKTETADLGAVPDLSSTWRQELLQLSLNAWLIVGLFVVGARGYRAYIGGDSVLLALYVLAYSSLLLVATWKRMPYTVRVASFLISIYAVALLELVQFGHGGSALILLLAPPVLAIVLFGGMTGFALLVTSSMTEALSAWAISRGRFTPLEQRAVSRGQPDWWTGAGTLLLLGGVLVVVQNRLIPHLSTARDKARKLHIGLANWRAQSEAQRQELKERARQLELVVEVGRIAASRLDIDRVLRRVVELVPDYVDCYLVSIFLFDKGGEALTLRAATGALGGQLEANGLQLKIADAGIVGWVAKHRKVYVAPDVGTDDVYRPHPGLGGTMSELALPLKAGGFLLGVMDIQAGSRDAFDDDEVRVLECVADELAMALQSARQMSDEVAYLEVTSPFYRLNRRLSGATTVEEVVGVILDSVSETEADGCLIASFEQSSPGQAASLRILGTEDRAKRRLSIEFDGENRQCELRPGVELPLSQAPLPLDLMEQFWAVTDVANDDRLPDDVRAVLESMDVGACVNVPLQTDGRTVGQVLVLHSKPTVFSQRSLHLFDLMRGQAAMALMRAWRLEEAQRRARREELSARATARMHESLDLETVLNTAAHDIGETLGLAALSVQLGPIQAPFDVEKTGRGNGGSPQPEDRRRGEE